MFSSKFNECPTLEYPVSIQWDKENNILTSQLIGAKYHYKKGNLLQ